MPANATKPNIPNAWRPSAAAESALRELIGHSVKLPSVPALYYQVVTELESPRGSIDFVARLVAKDPAMCARILQTINSAAFAPSQPVTSPHEAVLYLGAESVKAIILFEQTLAPFKTTVCSGFSFAELWRHSASVGSFASKIATMEGADSEITHACFTAGILHDLGKLFFLGNMTERYTTVLGQTRQNVSLHQAEEQTFGVNHADLGALLLSSWGLPQKLVDAIGWHHHPILSGDSAFSLLTAVHVANGIDHELHRASATQQPASIDRDYLTTIGLQDRVDFWRAACGCPVKHP